MTEVGSVQVGVRLDQAGLRTQIAKAEAQLSVLASKPQTANVILKQDALKAQIASAKADFERLVGRSYEAQIRAETGSAKAELGKFAQFAQTIVQGIGQGIGQKLSEVISKPLFAAAALPLKAVESTLGAGANFVGNSVQKYIAYAGTLKSISVVGGESKEKVAELTKEIERLSLNTSKSPREIAAVSLELIKQGQSADILKASLEGVVRGSEASGESVETLGSIVGSTRNQFGLLGESAKENADISNRIAGGLVATANASATGVASLGESLSYVGVNARAADQSLEDTLVVLGLMANAGKVGSAAGTDLSEALRSLKITSASAATDLDITAKGSKKAVEAFEVLKVGIRDGNGQMKSLLEILPLLQGRLKELSQGDQDVLINTLFGAQGGRAIGTLLGTTKGQIDEMVAAVSQGQSTLKSSGEAMLQGTGGAIALFTGSLELAGNRIGKALDPAVEAGVKFATKALNGLLETEDTFEGLEGAAKKFGDELANNDEFAKQVQESLKLAVDQLAESGVQTIETFTEILKENPTILADMVSAMAGFVNLIGQGIALAAKLGAGLAEAADTMSAATDPLYGQKSALRAQGATRADLKALDEAFNKRTAEAARKDPLGYLGDDYEQIAQEETIRLETALRERNKQATIAKQFKEAEADQLAKLDKFAGEQIAKKNAEKEAAKVAKLVKPTGKPSAKKLEKSSMAEFKALQASNQQKLSEIQATEGEALAAVKQAEAAKRLTREESEAKQRAIRRKSLEDQLKLEQQAQKAFEKASKGKLTGKADKEALGARNRVADIKGAIADIDIQGQQGGKDKPKRTIDPLKAAQARLKSRLAQDDQAEAQDILRAKQAQLRGDLTADQAANKQAKAKQNSLKRQLEAQKALQADLGNVKPTKENKEALTQSRADAIAKQKQLETQLIDFQIAEQERLKAAREKALADQLTQVAKASKSRQDLADQEANREALTISKLQASKKITTEEANVRLAALDVKRTQQAIALANQESAQLAALKTQGLEGAKQVAEQREALANQVNQLEVQLGNAQIALEARKVEVAKAGIAQRLQAAETATNRELQLNQQANFNAQSRLDYLGSLRSVEEASNALGEQRLQASVEAAKTDQERAKLEYQLAVAREANAQRVNQLALLELETRIKMAEIERERAMLASQLEVLNAQAALEAAKVEGATQTQLDSLSQILSLKKQIAGQTQEAAMYEQTVAYNQRESLRLQQQASNERLAQEKAQKAKAANGQLSPSASPGSPSKASSGVSGGSSGLGASGGLTGASGGASYTLMGNQLQQDKEASRIFSQAMTAIGDKGKNLASALASSGNNPFLQQRISGAGLDGIVNQAIQATPLWQQMNGTIAKMSSQMAQQPTNGGLGGKIDELGASIDNLASRPQQLTIQTTNPAGDVGKVYNGLSNAKTFTAQTGY